MNNLLLSWMFWNAVLGGAIVTVGAILATRTHSPVRRLRILEWTFAAALFAPILATAQHPWQWSLGLLPAHEVAVSQSDISETRSDDSTNSIDRRIENRAFPANVPAADPALVSTPAAPSSSTDEAVPTDRSAISMSTIIPSVQAIAVLVSFGWWLIAIVALARIWKRAAPANESTVHLLPMHGKTLARGRVEIRTSNEIPTACAFGLFRWCIMLPESLVNSGQSETIRFALAHEGAHLSRGDLWTWRFARLLQLTLWFQPAYWWARHQVRLCQDFLADAEAAETGTAEDFATFLVDCVRKPLGWSLATTLPLSSRPSDLKRRITMLLKHDHPLERHCPKRLQVLALCAVTFVLTAAALVRLEAQEAKPKESEEQATAKVKQSKEISAADSQEKMLTYTCRVLTKGTDAPIAGAKIQVARRLSGDPRYPKGHTIEVTKHTTDENGNYTVVIPPEQSRERYLYLKLNVEHPDHMAKRGFGYSFTMIRKNESLGERPFFETTYLHAAKAVTGRLLKPNGQPAGGVKISGNQYPGESPLDDVDGYRGSFFEENTNGDGTFSVPIATPGHGAFWFKPDDVAPLGVVAPDERGDIGDVQLNAGQSVTGRVLDTEGEPVANVELHVYRQSSESAEIDAFNRTSMAVGGYNRLATTDENGEYKLPPIEPGKYEFRVAEGAKSEGKAIFAGAFLNQTIDIEATTDTLDFQALPTVTITVRNMDSAGNPKRGYKFDAWGYADDEKKWHHSQSSRSADGVCVAEVPLGMTKVSVSFTDNEHGSYRVRRTPDAKPEGVSRLELGSVDADVEGIEVIRYKAPILLVKVVDADGNMVSDINKVFLTPIEASERELSKGHWNTHFEKQQDGRWRSSSMLPDEPYKVIVEKEGWKADQSQISLVEGEEKEIVITMKPE